MRRPNGLGTVQKLGGARRRPYAARITVEWVDGKQRLKNIGYYATAAEALAALADYSRNPYELAARDITLAGLFGRWIEGAPELSNSRLRGLRGAFKICEPLHRTQYADIRAPHIRRVMATAAPTAKAVIKALFMHLDKYARELGIITTAQSEFITAPTPEPKRERRTFTNSEIGRLWERVDAPDVDAVLILLYSGWRVSELLNLKKSDVDIITGTMRGGVKTKNGKGRIIPIHSAILPLIKNRMAAGDSEYLIPAARGGVMDYRIFRERYDIVMGMIGARHIIHETRHTFRTALDNAGARLSCAAKLMGHTCADIGLAIYTHKTIKELAAAVEMVDYSEGGAPAVIPLFSAAAI